MIERIRTMYCLKNNEQLSIYMLYVLLILNPFHFYLYNKMVYYREFFTLFFSFLCVFKFAAEHSKIEQNTQNNILSIMVFPFVLIFFAFFDPLHNLYGNDITETSLHLRTINPTLYIFRNVILYLPMVLYFALRGLSESEIRKIALITILVAPLSIFGFIYFHNLATLRTFWILSTLAGAGMQYNTYIPYLTFPALSAIYLLNQKSCSNTIKFVSFSVLVFISIYLLLATSRQSILYVLICGAVFLVRNKELGFLKKLSITLAYITITFVLLKIIVKGVTLESLQWSNFSLGKSIDYFFDSLIPDFSRADKMATIKTPRWEIIIHGLSLLSPSEFFTGAGLTSVINSGPHNDFVRWTQRIGVVGAFVSFYIFFSAFFSTIKYEKQCINNNACYLYLLMTIVFTLYHSMFGYPREDAYQSLYCFLGLSLYLGYRTNYNFGLKGIHLQSPISLPLGSLNTKH